MALITGGCVDVLQPDATRCGLLAASEAMARARQAGLRVATHSFTTALNATAHVHLVAGTGDVEAMVEWPVHQLQIWAELFPGAPGCVGGRIAVPQSPGWGVSPDPGVLQRLNVHPMGVHQR